MAGKGGGAWKVAYADFVTAMMAFFMVMWLLAQNQEAKESVAHYFNDPTGFRPFGTGITPRKAGSLLQDTHAQRMPESDMLLHPRDGSGEFETGVVRNWLVSDKKRHRAWLDRAQALSERFSRSSLVADQVLSKDQAVRIELAQALKDSVSTELQLDEGTLAGRMLSASLSAVNWGTISNELLQGE